MRFDAQCDIASIAYGAGDDPDRLLTGFAEDLTRTGVRLIGVIQSGHDCRSESNRLGVVVLPGREVFSLVPNLQPGMDSCQLEASRLDVLAQQLSADIAAGADLMIINRFGHLEAEGKGLVPVIAQALDADIPVLIAVPGKRFAEWIRFCSGMNVRLACNRDALDKWWQSVAATPTRKLPIAADTFCEVAK